MLSDEQLNIINTIKENKNVICDAVAGSGKTTTVLELAKALPDKLILQITYNSILRHEVKDKAKDIKNIKIHSYHSLYVNYYNTYAYSDIIINNVIDNNTPPIKELPKFDIIVIDEVQDMTILFYSAILKFTNDLQKNVQYLLLGDKNQTVYDFKGADNRFLTLAIDLYPNSVVLPLSHSFRVTVSIANFVNFVLLGKYRIKTLKKGSNVNYLICNTFKIVSKRSIRDTKINNYKLTGRPAHDGLAQVDYSASGRRSGALQRGSGPIICEPGLEVCFDAAASSLAVRQRIRAAGWAVSVIGSLLRACGVRLCSDRCAWDAGRRFLSCGG